MISLDNLFPKHQPWILSEVYNYKAYESYIGEEFYVHSAGTTRGENIVRLILFTEDLHHIMTYYSHAHKFLLCPKFMLSEKEMFTYKMTGVPPQSTYMQDMIKWWMVYNT